MSETSSVSGGVNQLTISDVIDPNRTFSDSVLGQALANKAKKASEALVGLAEKIVDRAGNMAASYAQEKKELEAALAANKKRADKLAAYVAYTESSKNLFALAAHVGMKSVAVDFAGVNGLVVPASTDPVWALPE